MAPTKRKFSELQNDNLAIDLITRDNKRRRLTKSHSSNAKVTTKLFDKPDQFFFQQKFCQINQSQLINKLKVPEAISIVIAEFATGSTELCGNPRCDDKITVLCQDWAIYNRDHANANKVGYKYVKSIKGVRSRYYCISCMHDLVNCGCNFCIDNKNCTLFHPNNHSLCDKCGILITPCSQRCHCSLNGCCSNEQCQAKYCGRCCMEISECTKFHQYLRDTNNY